MKEQTDSIVMVRNERLVFYSLISVAPYSNRVLIADNGSTDNTVNDILLAKSVMLRDYGYDNIELYYGKELLGVEIPDLTSYNVPDLSSGKQKLSIEITNVRQKLTDMSTAKWINFFDGDEVYTEKIYNDAFNKMKELGNDEQIACLSIPLLWFYPDIHHVISIYSPTSRFHLRADSHFSQPFPREELRDRYGARLVPSSPRSMTLHTEPFYHYSRMLKPIRQDGTFHTMTPFTGKQPDVFLKYPEILQREGISL